ncbi:pericentriolar material 1 protein-like isoform X1 [Schistocerca cancellata]|uniref:pericentriolar material 1 protein-like isoform X1 n=2 Tax=Schistocerca cancellata TaxID=274614 RepID=UPI0021174E37|nr:pericentriolar material 1 protein-like isoform X1 [Schistocerca cancellata]XP_049779011.1 pericentriolar material 1 protein-like isoform X1 [Schistocerca cancellata]
MSPDGRYTGTVPKTSTHKGSTRRDTSALRRQEHRSNVPNNLVSQDSRYTGSISQHSQRHTRKASNTRTESLDPGPVDCTSIGTHHLLHTEELQGNWSVHNFLPATMNGHEATAARNMVQDKDSKSNISKPDRAQVVSRLNQIRDYIKQTTTLMDALKASGDPRQEAQRQKLSGMVEDLRDSESKLQSLADKLERAERRLSHCERQNSSETGSCASSTRSYSHSEERERRSTSLVRAAATAKHNELKLMVEESQRKLQALQEHQAALVALQQKAKEQLQRTKAAQNTVSSIESGIGTGDQPQSSSDVLRDVQNLQHRISVLHEFYDNRNQIVELLGERDEALLSEHTVLQDKLTELQVKKRHMDQLLAQFSALNNSDANDEAGETGSLAEGSDGDVDVVVEQVQNRMAEFSSLKSQLAHLQNVVATINLDSSGGERDNPEQNEAEQENELAVNLCVRNKPDNISSEGERERARDIHNKAIKLQEARARLQHLQQLLATVVDLQSSGQSVPQHYLDQLAQETASDDGSKEAAPQDSPAEVTSQAEQERHSFERPPLKEKRTNTQADAQRLQARRRELEQLMQKDQCQSSSVNQSEPGCGTGDTGTSNATWGNSTQITLEDLDDGRAGFSSDDNLCEENNDIPSVSSQRNARLSCSGSNRKDILEHNTSSNRDAVDMSLDSSMPGSAARPSSQNIWRKISSGSNNAAPRAVWTPSSQHCNVPEDTGSTANFGTNHDGEANSTNHSNYNPWQHALLLEQQQQQQHQQYNANSYYQQLWAASQVQQQQALLTTVNQCCQMLWSQQREIASLRAAVSALQQERVGTRLETQLPLSNELLNESSTIQNAKPVPAVNNGGPYSSGLLADSVASAHSLPNLVVPSAAPVHTLPLPVPVPAPPPPPSSVVRSPQALNNQVPPGNRANNYWDNFRSYSRQNLLSTSTKTNEVLSERSRNALHSSCRQVSQQKPVASSAISPDHSVVAASSSSLPCKEKLNTKCLDGNVGNVSLPGRWPIQDHTNNSSGNTGHQVNRHKQKKPSMEQSLGEVLYSEFTALVAANENQQHFFLQLFENLKQVNSEPLRQGTLQVLQNFLSQQSHNNNPLNSTQSTETPHPQSDTRTTENATTESFASSTGDVVIKSEVSGCSDLFSCEYDDNIEGAAALAPQHAVWNNKDAFDLTLQVGYGQKLDWEVQAVLVDIIPFLKAHLDDICTPALLEAVRELAVHLPPTLSVASNVVAATAGGDSHGQLDALLEDALLKFQGCRLRDVGEELLTAIAEVVQSELTFLRFVDTVRRDEEPSGPVTTENITETFSVTDNPEPADPVTTDNIAENFTTANNQEATEPASTENNAESFPSAIDQGHGETVAPDDCNRDLAEADQSCPDDCVDVQPHISDSAVPTECSNELQVGYGQKLDWEVQAVLVDIIPFLKAHLDDICTPALLEAVRELAVHLPPTLSVASNVVATTAAGGSHGQLDALLEDALLKFHGCRLRDVGEELLTAIAEVVQSELTFLRLVDTVRRDSEEPTEPVTTENIAETFTLANKQETAEPASTTENITEASSPVTNQDSAELWVIESISEASTSPNDRGHTETVAPEDCNGDLAEADQSCPDDCVDVRLHTPVPAAPSECSNEAEAHWEMDQSLDQIPSRLLNSFPGVDTSSPSCL